MAAEEIGVLPLAAFAAAVKNTILETTVRKELSIKSHRFTA